MTKPPENVHVEFAPEIDKLRQTRPTLTPLELERARLRARASAGRPPVRAQRAFPRTSAALVAVIAFGFVMSTGGVAIGVSDWASSGGASVAQYSTPGVQGNGASGVALPARSAGAPSAAAPGQAVSAAEQVAQPQESSSGELPFTGFVAIPLLIIGLALMVVGALTRRAVRRTAGAPER